MDLVKELAQPSSKYQESDLKFELDFPLAELVVEGLFGYYRLQLLARIGFAMLVLGIERAIAIHPMSLLR